MPFIAIPRAAVAGLIKAEREAREKDDDWHIAYRHGFVDGLRAVLRSEQVGCIIMEADCALDGEPGLPKLEFVDPEAQ